MLKKLLGLVIAIGLLCATELNAKPSSGGGSRPSFSGGSKPSSSGSIKFSGSSSSPPKFSGGSNNPPSSPTFGGGSSSPHASKGSATDKPSFGGGSTSPPAKTITSTPIEGRTPTSVSKKPVAESFNKLSGTEARKIESRKSYERSETPASSYRTSAGKEVPIARGDKSSEYLRGRLDESHWQTRHQRTDVFYHSYGSRPIVMYNDYYHPMWNYWLMSQTIDVMSLWVYHHQMSMDRARLDAMYAQNADLRARVANLERQGIPRDVTYTPRGVDPDLMYDDNYVTAVYNPRPKTIDHYEYDNPQHSSNIGHVLLWIFIYIPLMCLGVFCLYWLCCKHRY